MGGFSRKDFISDLPQSIIDIILTKVPIRDAVRTSILSRKWRYQWATMTQLVLETACSSLSDGRNVPEKVLPNFIMRFLLLHDGSIHKFKLYNKYSIRSTDMDQWLLLLSRKDVKELVLKLYRVDWLHKDQWFHLPSCIFSCKKLTKLKLVGFDVKPPAVFQGFPCLKSLNLSAGMFTPEVIENLISGCPLLEKFEFRNVVDPLSLAIYAPNLKTLTLSGFFTNLYLKHTPLLAALSVHFYAQAWEGNVLWKVPVTFNCLKFIELLDISYEETNNVLNVLNLILRSPNLQELQIDTGIIIMDDKASDLDLWEKECPADFTFKHLKKVMMSGVSNENCVEFLKVVLGHSPVLEAMIISPHEDYTEKMNMANEVLHCRRASPKVDIRFFD